MKIRIFLLALTMMSFSLTLHAQEEAAPSTKPKDSGMYKYIQMKYVFAMKYNDWRAAANSLYDLIALDPMDDSLKLNLGYLYYDNNVFASALFVSADLLTRHPQNPQALQLSGLCYENMGLKAKAVDAYETLYMATESIDVLFNTAALQFELQRYSEATTNAKIVAENSQAKEIKLNYPISETEKQEIPMNAAAYNLLGVIEKEQGNKEQAKSYFEKALAIAPEFKMAKDGKNELN